MIPPRKKTLLDDVVEALRSVPGIAAIALGGSHARGTHRPDSDLDIGLYYREAAPFAVSDIRNIAERFASAPPTVTGFYEWGPFVNGGAWIENPVCKIDFIYRNIEQLERTIEDAERGKSEHSYDQHPPFGFRSVTTLGEIACAEPLFDPNGILLALKRRVAVYPPKLKSNLIQTMLWGAEFSFVFAKGFAMDGDVPNTVGCMTRIYHYLVHALFALNETYLVNDKRIAAVIEGFAIKPAGFIARSNAIIGQAGTAPSELGSSLEELKALFDETVPLAKDLYRSRYRMPSAAADR